MAKNPVSRFAPPPTEMLFHPKSTPPQSKEGLTICCANAPHSTAKSITIITDSFFIFSSYIAETKVQSHAIRIP
jgi:hypothetical protein